MKSRTHVWSRIAAALLVAIGLQIVWGIVFMYTTAILASMRQDGLQRYESLIIAIDGTPMIGTYTGSEWTYRTLDGKPVTDDSNEVLNGAYLLEPTKPLAFFESPVSWNARITDAMWDQKKPTTIWYGVRNDGPNGRAYLVGYDGKSKRLVGYIGRKGFRVALPPEEEWFEVGRRTMTVGGGEAMLTFGRGGYIEGNAALFDLFVIDRDALYQVDLGARSARKVFEAKGLLTLSWLSERRNAAQETDAEKKAIAAAAAKAGIDLPDINYRQRIVLRTNDRIIILNPATLESVEYGLPPSARDGMIQVYALPDKQLLVVETIDMKDQRTKLSWLGPDGSVKREEDLKLVGYRPPMGESAAVAVLAAPVPVGWMLAVFTPISAMRADPALTYQDAVGDAIRAAGPAFWVVLLIGIVLAGWTYAIQRKYRRADSALWCAFAFLFGGPGFLAYLFEHHKPKLEECKECHQVVPRDRDVCAVCNTPFAVPPLVGTEIFA